MAFADEGIEIVDAPAKVKVGDKTDGRGHADDERTKRTRLEAKEEAKEDEDADSYAPTSDPVRTYLRRMGTISLLTREGEVEIAKRIEDGDRHVLQVVLSSSVAIQEILGLGDKLRKHGSASRTSSGTSTRRTPSSTRNGTSTVSARSSTRSAGSGPIRRAVSSRRSWTPSRTCASTRSRSTSSSSGSRGSSIASPRPVARSPSASTGRVCPRRSSSRLYATSARRPCASGRSPRSSACGPRRSRSSRRPSPPPRRRSRRSRKRPS